MAIEIKQKVIMKKMMMMTKKNKKRAARSPNQAIPLP